MSLAPVSQIARPLNPGEELQLGTKVYDDVTGIMGWAYYRILHLRSCDHIAIAQPDATKDGKMKELYCTDVSNIKILMDQSDALPAPKPQNPTIWVGDYVRDPITQREGTVVGYNICLFDGRHLHVQPRGADPDTGKAKHNFNMEEARAILLNEGPNHGKPIVYSEAAPVPRAGCTNMSIRQPD